MSESVCKCKKESLCECVCMSVCVRGAHTLSREQKKIISFFFNVLKSINNFRYQEHIDFKIMVWMS